MLLAIETRCGLDEVRHHGCVAISVASGSNAYGTEGVTGIPLRSTGKPFFLGGLVGSVLRGETFSSAELAIMSSSHNGEPQHVSVVLELLTRYGLSTELVRCATHEKWRDWTIHSPLGNNCSGKHVAFLIASRVAGLDPRDYLDPNSVINQQVSAELRLPFSTKPVALGVDGCSIPTYAFPLRSIADAYRDFATDNIAESYARVRRAHLSAPFYVGGTDRLESYLIANYGLAAKSGSAGLWAVGAPAQGLGIAVKIWSGAEYAAQAVLLEILRQQGVLDPSTDPYLRGYYNRPIHSLAGKPSGEFKVCFPERP